MMQAGGLQDPSPMVRFAWDALNVNEALMDLLKTHTGFTAHVDFAITGPHSMFAEQWALELRGEGLKVLN